MFLFNPPDLENEFRQSLNVLRKNFAEKDMKELLYDFDFNEESTDEILITPETKINLGITEFTDVSLTVTELIDFIKEFETAIIVDNVECWTSKRVLIKVQPENFEAQKFIQYAIREANTSEEEKILEEYVEIIKKALSQKKSINIYKNDLSDDEKEQVKEYMKITETQRKYTELVETPTEHFCSQKISTGDNSITCMLTKNFTMFGFKILAIGDFTEDFPPLYEDDVFVEIRFEKTISKELAYSILEAFLFELSSTLGAVFKISPRPNFEDFFDEEEFPIVSPRIRPLLLGNGMLELLKLYNRGVESDNPEIRLLYLTKVIEFVSQTVIQQQFLESVRTKLLSRDALNPDAKYINDLAILIDEQREFRKDKEAIRLTVLTCCDVVELGKYSPKFLSELKRVTQNSKRKEREDALSKLAVSISATRNSIAHAKANYQPTGEECPNEEMGEFASLIAIAAQQVIRWYHSRHDVIKVY